MPYQAAILFTFCLILSQVVISFDCSVSASITSSIPLSELNALLELKARIVKSTASKSFLGAWNASNAQNICESWVGVTCGQLGDHISGVNLADFGLEGSLPPQLGNLTFLSTLILSSNHFTGGIPAELSGCSALQVLDLKHNMLTGSIPSSLSSLSNLQVLRLCENRLGGQLPPSLFTNCTSLLTLSLCENAFTGSIPSPHLPKLWKLNLAGNNLTGPIPSAIAQNSTQLSQLQLSRNGLSGQIPTEFGSLIHLSMLSLDQNHLSGAIPRSLGKCKSLLRLNLFANQLTSGIPKELGGLTNLSGLRFYQNNLTDTSLGSCSLEFLELQENWLTGAIPSSLGECKSLKRIFLFENQLSGSIPWELGTLSNLLGLRLYNNNLTGVIPHSLGNCSSLLVLDLSYNQLLGPIPSELGLLSQLQSLYLLQNHLMGPIPPSLGNCSRLFVIEFCTSQLSGFIPPELGRLAQLTTLDFSGNNLTGPIPSTLGNCTQLSRLQLSTNRLTGFIPLEIMQLKNLTYLKLFGNSLVGFKLPFSFNSTMSSLLELRASFNKLGGSIPRELGQLQQLQLLDLSHNELSGVIPWDSISNCSSLDHLDLSNNHLTGSLSSKLKKLPKLQWLDLHSNLLQGAIPDMGALRLQVALDLSFNQFNGTLPDSLASVFKNVKSLNFSHNDLSGSLPLWLGEQLMMVQEIDLSHNHFVGIIPESLGECKALTSLNLSSNQLVGEFPLFLGHNSSLSLLDLSNNELTGVLPSTTPEYFQSLGRLNISFNNFEGPIPLLGVFAHLDASSFRGNPKLCGQIIHKPCKSVHSRWKMRTVAVLTTVAITLTATILAICTYRYCRRLGAVDREFKSLVGIRHFSADELSESTQGYSKLTFLGEGALGVVYKGVLSNGEVVAVKKFKEDAAICSREALLQEVHILSKLKHRNLVRILGCVINLEINALVLEFMSNGSLERYLHRDVQEDQDHGSLSWPNIFKVAQGVANALTYLHHEYDVAPIVHGDVKPSNILLDPELEAHLADFGLAKLAKDDTGAISLSSNFCKGSIGYMAPEFAYAAKITSKVDVYSFGVVVLEMLTGRGPTDELLHGMSLHEWVKHKLLLHTDGIDLGQIVRPSLVQSSSLTTLDDLLRMAVACTEDMPTKRPSMRHIKAFLDSQQYTACEEVQC